jgi:hypothetical protein
MEPGPHRWILRAFDLAGRIASVEIPVRLDPPAALPRLPAPAGPESRGEMLLAAGGPLRALSPRGEPHLLEGGAGGLGSPPGGERGSWEFRTGDDRVFHAVWGDTVPGTVTANLDGASLVLDGETLFHPAWITWRWKAAPAPASTLLPQSRVLVLGPWAAPLRERATLRFAAPEGVSRRGLGLFRLEDGAWSFLGADTSGRGVAADLVSLEDVALLRDDTPPQVKIEIGGGGRRPLLVAHVVDRGAGVTWRTLFMEVDGESVLAEWDADGARLRAHLRRDLAPGEHLLRVRAEDRVGNAARAEARFLVR